MNRLEFTGDKLKEISFPIGGIGSGCIGLAGNGRLIDWEIFNKPNKGSVNGFSHFAIKAEKDGKLLDLRILNAPLDKNLMGEFQTRQFTSYGWGPRREYLAGLPHFKEVVFRGEFPFAELEFSHDDFPGKVLLTGFNPFIPLNVKDSAIPAAFFQIQVTNTTDEAIEYSVVSVLANPLKPNHIHDYKRSDSISSLFLTSDGVPEDKTEFGNLCISTDSEDVSNQNFWFRGRWFDDLEIYWKDMQDYGKIKNRQYDIKENTAGGGATLIPEDHGCLVSHMTAGPGEVSEVRYVISWYFPNCENYWGKHYQTQNKGDAAQDDGSNHWKNYYASFWTDARDVGHYCLENWEWLFTDTKKFKDTLFSSTIPDTALDAVASNLSMLNTPTTLLLEDGTFYGWEGLHPDSGCCEGSCTHVWNYAQALPFLFPELERSMRTADFKYNMHENGGMSFRIQLPLGSPPNKFRPCVDGQYGGVMKTYRDWKISGDTQWLKEIWPRVKKCIEYAWSQDNVDLWDPDKTGVITGRQHHTLDMELFGPSSWLNGFYLGALKAGAEMAEHLGEQDVADDYYSLFEKGKAYTDTNLFNGEYYFQQVDLHNKSTLDPYYDAEKKKMEMERWETSIYDTYWDEEHHQVKYQVGEGCIIDQVLAQWHANLYGLGDLLDPGQVKTALRSLFKNNFYPNISDVPNFYRIYAVDDEGGLLICTWPEGSERPSIPVPYAYETMHGFEYAAAINMIGYGLVDEGMSVVSAIRDRYNGENRNPWNEIECGNNYARSNASYALLNAFSGFEFDMVNGQIGFAPIKNGADTFKCFWSLDSAWGAFEQNSSGVTIDVGYGHLDLNTLHLPSIDSSKVKEITIDGNPTGFKEEGGYYHFEQKVKAEAGVEIAY